MNKPSQLTITAKRALDKATIELNRDRQENTHKRSREAGQARSEARLNIAMASSALAICALQDAGNAGALEKVRNFYQVTSLFWALAKERRAFVTDNYAPIQETHVDAANWDGCYTSSREADRRQHFEQVGVHDDASYRAILLAYGNVLTPPPAECPIKAAVAKLVGTKIPGFFPTPPLLVEEMIRLADLAPGMTVLEPSAGKGDIADAVAQIVGQSNLVCIETNLSLFDILIAKGHNAWRRDFLADDTERPSASDVYPDPFDRILMNPPFENGQDIAHVQRAYELLKPGGILVAIVCANVATREDKKYKAFREWLSVPQVEGRDDRFPIVRRNEANPAGSFDVGDFRTGTSTRMLMLMKPEEAVDPIQCAKDRIEIGKDPSHPDWYEGMTEDGQEELRNALHNAGMEHPEDCQCVKCEGEPDDGLSPEEQAGTEDHVVKIVDGSGLLRGYLADGAIGGCSQDPAQAIPMTGVFAARIAAGIEAGLRMLDGSFTATAIALAEVN